MEAEQEEAAPEQHDNYPHLSRCLTAEELESTPVPIRSKLETIFQEREDDVLVARALKRDAEVVHETETQLLQKALEEKTSETDTLNLTITNLNGEIADLEEKLKDALSQKEKAFASAKTMENEWRDFKTQRDLIRDEKMALTSMLERRDAEIAELKRDKETLTEQLKYAIDAKIVALEKSEDVESLRITLGFKEKRLEQESALLKAQLQSINDDLNAKNQEILQLQRVNAGRHVKFESELAANVEKLNVANNLIKELRSENATLQSRYENLVERMQNQRIFSDQMVDKLQQEVSAQTRLVQLYKEMSNEDETKTKKLTDLIEDLQKLLADSTEKYKQMEENYNSLKIEYDIELSKRDQCIDCLKKELKHANELLEATKKENRESAIEELSPYAASASRLIKSGMNLTQIYTQYATVSEELILLKEENRKLNLSISTILAEIEDKAPILKQQRIDYQKAVANVESLTQQLDRMIVESNSLHDECREAKKLSTHLTRENQRLQKELADLARQVCYLLKTVEESRGTVVSNEQYIDPNECSSAQMVISKKLVTFASIQDLQENNQKLLGLVRLLSEKQEQAEGVSIQEFQDCLAMKNRLEERIQELLDEMSRQSKMLDLIRGQSERYQKLYKQAIDGKVIEELPDKSPKLVTSTPTKAMEVDESTKLTELQKQFDEALEKIKKLEKDRADLREALNEKDKVWIDKYEKLRLEIVELTSSKSKLTTQIEFADEKCKVLEGNTKVLKNQIKALEERNRTLSDICARHEENLVVLKDQAMDSLGKIAQFEIQRENLQKENFMLKASEMRLKKEIEDLAKERVGHSRLQTNVDALKAVIERSEAEGKLRLEMQLNDTVKECQSLRKMLNDEKEQFKHLVNSLERDANSAKEQMLMEKAEADKCRGLVDGLKNDLDAKIKEVEELKGKLRESSNQPIKMAIQSATCAADTSLKHVKELEEKCQQLNAETALLKQQLTAAQTHSKQYAEMAEISETQLRTISETHEKCQEVLNKCKLEAENRENELRTKLSDLENQLSNIKTNHQLNESNSSLIITDVNEKLKSAEATIDELNKKLELYEELEKSNNSSLKTISELEKKYSQEVILHSNDIQALDNVKSELITIQKELMTIKKERDEAVAFKNAERDKLKKLEDNNKKITDEFERRIADLQEHNNLLLDQLQQMGDQINKAQAKISSNELLDNLSIDQSMELNVSAQDELQKVIKFLRKEKDIYFTRCDALQAESQRYQSQIAFLSKELDSLKESYKLLQESVDVKQKTTADQAVLLRKIEACDAIADSNRILRDERKRMQGELEELRAKVMKYENDNDLKRENDDLKSRIETLVAERNQLTEDVTKWRSIVDRSKSLQAEQWRKLSNDREALAKQYSAERSTREKAEEELKKLKIELENLRENAHKQSLFDSNEIRRLTEDNSNMKQQLMKMEEGLSEVQTQVATLSDELMKACDNITKKDAVIADLKSRDIQVRKIAKKYKSSYEELLKTTEEEKKQREEEDKKRDEEGSRNHPVVVPDEEQERLRNEGRNEVADKVRELESRVSTVSDELENIKKENDNLKTAMTEKEERAKNVLKSARTKIQQLTEQKNTLEQELSQTRGQTDPNRDENKLKAQYESIISAMEKQRADTATETQLERDRLNNQIKSLNQRLIQYIRLCDKQKPSTSSQPLIVQKTSMDPPTANIKPMAGSSTARKQPQKQTTSQQAVAVGPFWTGNDTPFASIRPVQTRTLAVQPTSLVATATAASGSNATSAQATPASVATASSATQSAVPTAGPSGSTQPAIGGAVMVPPQQQQQQVVHTTGGTRDNSQSDAVISSPTSSHTDYMPATSSAPLIRVVVAPTTLNAQSTQEPEEVITVEESQSTQSAPVTHQVAQSAPSAASSGAGTSSLAQPTALVLPTALQPGPSCSSSSSGAASSSSTVTTTQAGLKRTRGDLDGDGMGQDDGVKAVQQSKRTRMTVTGSTGPSEVFLHLHQVPQVSQATLLTNSEGIDVEYQVPTSSQRDQEDDIVIMLDSEDDGNADEGEVEPDEQEFEEEENAEVYEMESYSHDGQDIVMASYDDGPDIDEEEEEEEPTVAGDNNEVEVIEDSNEVPGGGSVTGVATDGGSNSGINTPMPGIASASAQTAASQQSSEATSSGTSDGATTGDHVVVSHAASSQSPSAFRTRSVPPLARPQTSTSGSSSSAGPSTAAYVDESVDDSIVPSTPTLFLPRRLDGFAEVVSSPQMPHQQRFSFPEPVAGTSRRDQDGQNMEDGSTGRSVPTTPMQVSPQEPGQETASASETTTVPHISVALSDESIAQPEIISVSGADPEASAIKQPSSDDEETATVAAAPITIDDGDCSSGVTSEGEKPQRMIPEEGREAEASQSQQSEGDVRVTQTHVTRRGEAIAVRAFRRNGATAARRPIVWNEPGSSGLPPNNQHSRTITRAMSPDFLRRGNIGRGRRNWRS